MPNINPSNSKKDPKSDMVGRNTTNILMRLLLKLDELNFCVE